MVYNDSIIAYGISSRNGAGEEVWGTGHSIPARVVEESSKVLSPQNEITLSDLTVHIKLEDQEYATVGSKLSHGTNDYLILEIKKPQNEVGHIRDVKFKCKKHD